MGLIYHPSKHSHTPHTKSPLKLHKAELFVLIYNINNIIIIMTCTNRNYMIVLPTNVQRILHTIFIRVLATASYY